MIRCPRTRLVTDVRREKGLKSFCKGFICSFCLNHMSNTSIFKLFWRGWKYRIQWLRCEKFSHVHSLSYIESTVSANQFAVSTSQEISIAESSTFLSSKIWFAKGQPLANSLRSAFPFKKSNSQSKHHH
jgi:hypothetical protein